MREGGESQIPDRARLLDLRKWGGYDSERWNVTEKFRAGEWCGINFICGPLLCFVMHGKCIGDEAEGGDGFKRTCYGR